MLKPGSTSSCKFEPIYNEQFIEITACSASREIKDRYSLSLMYLIFKKFHRSYETVVELKISSFDSRNFKGKSYFLQII